MSLKILFLCGHNAGRSIAAESICKKIRPEIISGSAGTEPSKGLNLNMVKALQKKGFETKNLFPKNILSVGGLENWDMVITMGCMKKNCPVIPKGVNHKDWNLPDPALDKGCIPEIIKKLIENIKNLGY